MGTQATAQAIGRAIMEETERTTLQATENFNISFGSLSFTIHHGSDYFHNQQVTQPGIQSSQQSMPHARTIKNTVNHGLPLPTEEYPNTQTQPKQKHPNTKQNPNVRKFVKVAPATVEWQEAVSKAKHPMRKIKENRKCFFCQKKGHLQRYCWKRIKCFTCGRLGHKSVNCIFKCHNSSSSMQEKQPPTTHTVNCPHPPPQTMELIQGRPPLGEIFSPPNQALTEENDYLSRVGLIILIRGSHFPNLPHLLASALSETHGGPPSDYLISQATIAPYIVTCRSPQSKDSIVRRGLYSMFQGQVQFAVHEWRPRFGMGYDPPTHQVKVRIVGLPLQVWTESGVTGFLRNFGHPIQFLPFGQVLMPILSKLKFKFC